MITKMNNTMTAPAYTMTCAAAMNSAPNSRYNTASAPITATSEMALEIGCVCTTTLIAATTAIAAKIRKRMTSIQMATYETRATTKPVTSRFNTATGKRNFQANPISWSYRKRGSVPRIHMNVNRIPPVLAPNQNSGTSHDCTMGS